MSWCGCRAVESFSMKTLGWWNKAVLMLFMWVDEEKV